MNVLLTAFEPFGGSDTNQSMRVVKRVVADPGIHLHKAFLPVDYGDRTILDLLDDIQPDILVLTGEASGRRKMCLEHHAINVTYAETPDNQGVVKRGGPIIEDGPLALKNTCGFTEMMVSSPDSDHLRLSFSAGAYLCNMNYYLALHHARHHGSPGAVGFVHIPVFTDTDENGERLDRHVRVLQKIISDVVRNQRSL